MYAGMYKLDKNTELALSRLNPVNFLNKARMINANKHFLEMHGLIIPGGEYFKYIGDSPEYSTFFIYKYNTLYDKFTNAFCIDQTFIMNHKSSKIYLGGVEKPFCETYKNYDLYTIFNGKLHKIVVLQASLNEEAFKNDAIKYYLYDKASSPFREINFNRTEESLYAVRSLAVSLLLPITEKPDNHIRLYVWYMDYRLNGFGSSPLSNRLYDVTSGNNKNLEIAEYNNNRRVDIYRLKKCYSPALQNHYFIDLEPFVKWYRTNGIRVGNTVIKPYKIKTGIDRDIHKLNIRTWKDN